MAKSTRVYLLAKELGVKSQAIVEKCQAEGLEDIKNHMAVISVGLAATIREWFSEGEHTTAVEKAAPVDLKKVRVKRKKKKASEPTEEDKAAAQSETEPAAAASAEAPAEPTVESPPVEIDQPPQPVAESPQPAPATEPPVEPKPTEEPEKHEEPKKTEEPDVTEREESPASQEPTPEPKPEVIKPAGPMLEKPKPAKLSGPKVVRVESIEDDARRRPGPRRHGPKPRPKSPTSMEPQPPLPAAPPSGKGKKSSKLKTHGRRKDSGGEGVRRSRGGDIKRVRLRDLEERQARLAAAGGASKRAKPSRRIEARSAEDVSASSERPEKAVVHEPITVKDLSAALAVKTGDIITKLMNQGIMATANQAISTEAAELVALEFGTELMVERKRTLLEQIEEKFAARSRPHLQKRPPVVTMLGHVDHGKTSLLDRIRQTSVATGEAGGITQHIGAYQIELHGKRITFLDTPGHEAFTAMRARGANMTDIVILVVAADDGLMPQTIEAIHHAKAAGVAILVALNKIDLPGVDANRIYGQLAEHELTPREWGGQTEIIQTSAITGQGIEELLEHIDFTAEDLNFSADPTIPAYGWVVEAHMSPTKGSVATVLLKEGHLDKGDVVLAGGVYGRIRTVIDSRGRTVKIADPSMPVVITGLDGVPQAGDKFYCLDDINEAKQAAEEMQRLSREQTLAKRSQITLDNLFSHIAAGNIKELNLIVKADVQGSVDVLNKYLTDLSTEEVRVRIIHSGVGGINEGDVVLAEASGAIIIGFNVVPEDRVRQLAEAKGVDIRLYNIIYRITEDVRAAMIGMLEPDTEERTLGRAVVRNTFKVSSIGTIAGCYVTSGTITKNAKLRLIRNNIVVKDNCTIESLKHFKDDAREVRAGLECGIKIAGFDDVKLEDILEAFEVVQVKRDSL
ncbi:MAG TPA: translation initiation factor IF-2 [Phycisphaerales bacterium]|nr:translation initiation factor IF-2 [Phycisphaerales bacterium]